MLGPPERSLHLYPFVVGLMLAAGFGLGVVQRLRAQVADSAAQAITAAELEQHLEVFAADSLRGRTGSTAALEATARYVAAQFRALGLQPGRQGIPSDSAWLKRYPLPGNRRPFDAEASKLFLYVRIQGGRTGADVVHEGGESVQWVVPVPFATAARLVSDSVAESTLSEPVGRVVVVSGRPPAAPVPCDTRRRSIVFYIPPAGLDSIAQRTVVRQLTACAPVLMVASEDLATFAARRFAAARVSTALFQEVEATAGGRYWAVAVTALAVAPALAAAGLDLVATQADTIPQVRELPALMVWPELRFAEPRAVTDDAYGVYVVGVLGGSDTLQQGRGGTNATSYVVYSASADGDNPGAPDGGHDGGASVGALITLAKAFTQPGVRLRCSVVFLLTSGTRRHFAGTTTFLRPFGNNRVLSITLNGLSGLRGDTIPLAGLGDFIFAQHPDWLIALHPELGLKVIDGGTILTPISDHYAFARRGFVTLALGLTRPVASRAGVGRQDAGVGVDGAARSADDTGRLMRATRFAFYLGQDFANASVWPMWTPAARTTWLNGVAP